jgi:hypothetical protein
MQLWQRTSSATKRATTTRPSTDVAVDVDDGDRDGYVLFERLGLDAVRDVLRGGEQVHGRVLPSRE